MLFTLALCWGFVAHAAKPNIVMILVDDLGYSDLSSFGGNDIRTPAIDKLMSSGLRFDQFYSKFRGLRSVLQLFLKILYQCLKRQFYDQVLILIL